MTSRGLLFLGGLSACLLAGCLRSFTRSSADSAAATAKSQAHTVTQRKAPPAAGPIIPNPSAKGQTTSDSLRVPKATLGTVVVPETDDEQSGGDQKRMALGGLMVLPPGNKMPSDPGPQLGPVLPEAPLLKAPVEAKEPPAAPVIKVAPSPAESLIKALECMLDNKPGKALDHLKLYDGLTQDFFIRLLPALTRLTQKPIERMSSEEVSILQDELEALLNILGAHTDMTISRMCLCKVGSIKAFGDYEPMPEGHLYRAGTGVRPSDGELVHLYVELRNFSSECREPFHETRLSSKIEIRDPRESDGKPLWFCVLPDQQKPVRSRTRLHDFFNPYQFAVPHIPPGVYTLTLQVVDETIPGQRRVARRSVPFQVTALPAANP